MHELYVRATVNSLKQENSLIFFFWYPEYAYVCWLFTLVAKIFLGWQINFKRINILLLVPSSKL